MDTDVEKTADQPTQGPDHKIKKPFIHNRLRERFWL
jgi:hypothetical protein